MSKIKKITLNVSDEILRLAQKNTKQGISATVNKGLELLAAADAYEKLLSLRGKVKTSINIKELREDR